MPAEFGRFALTPDCSWVMPAARLVNDVITGGEGEPDEDLVRGIAYPDTHETYYRLSEGDKLIAMASVSSKNSLADVPPSEYALKLLAVQQNRQGEGFGRYMLRCIEREVIQLGATALSLYPLAEAREFYDRTGYTTHPLNSRYRIKQLASPTPPAKLSQSVQVGRREVYLSLTVKQFDNRDAYL